MPRKKNNSTEEFVLGEAEYEPEEKPFDPDYETKVRAADKLKKLPDQIEVPGMNLSEPTENIPAAEIVRNSYDQWEEKELKAVEKELAEEDAE